MNSVKALTAAFWAIASLALFGPASAEDTLKLAIGQKDNWENQVPALGTRAGIFKKHGIVLEMFGTQGAGETLQAVISGSADIGIGVGTPGALRAFSKGAPVRAIAAGFTGTNDLYWYVRADSAAPPFGLDAIEEGRIRIIARGSDAPSTRNQTVRVQIVNANSLAQRKDAIVRFMRAYREGLDWMYSDPLAVKYYAESIGKPERLVELSRKEFHPKEAILPDRISDIDSVMADSVALKFLDAPLTKAQLAEFFQIPPPDK